MFHLKFIKEGTINGRWGKLFSKLFNNRQEGDYGDFAAFDEEEIRPLLEEVEEFRIMIKDLIDKESLRSE